MQPNLYDLLNQEYSSVVVKNKTYYKKFSKKDSFDYFDFEELEKELKITEDEIGCIEESYINGLAASTQFLVINKEGKVVRGKLLVIS